MQLTISPAADSNLVAQDLDFVQSPMIHAGSVHAVAYEWSYRLARTIVGQVIPHHPSGFTFNPRSNTCLALGENTKAERYVVSIKGHELRFPRKPTEGELACWIAGRLGLLQHPGRYIGGWPYRDDYYLDVSVLIRGKVNALVFARKNEQLAIFHPASGQSLCVEAEISSIPTPAEIAVEKTQNIQGNDLFLANSRPGIALPNAS